MKHNIATLFIEIFVVSPSRRYFNSLLTPLNTGHRDCLRLSVRQAWRVCLSFALGSDRRLPSPVAVDSERMRRRPSTGHCWTVSIMIDSVVTILNPLHQLCQS